jgi:HEAT repeat protein
VRADVRNILIGIGPAIEEPILKQIDSISDSWARTELLEVLKKVGTKLSIKKLEDLAKDDRHMAIYIKRTLDAIRARQ